MVAKKRNEKTYTTLLLWRSRSKRAKSVPKGIESFCESWTKPYGVARKFREIRFQEQKVPGPK